MSVPFAPLWDLGRRRTYSLSRTDMKTHEEISMWFFCRGCDDLHRIAVAGPRAWTFDGNYEAPTVTPSILCTGAPTRRCHSFLRAGRLEFLGDCSHALAGQTVPLPDLPEWFT